MKPKEFLQWSVVYLVIATIILSGGYWLLGKTGLIVAVSVLLALIIAALLVFSGMKLSVYFAEKGATMASKTIIAHAGVSREQLKLYQSLVKRPVMPELPAQQTPELPMVPELPQAHLPEGYTILGLDDEDEI